MSPLGSPYTSQTGDGWEWQGIAGDGQG